MDAVNPSSASPDRDATPTDGQPPAEAPRPGFARRRLLQAAGVTAVAAGAVSHQVGAAKSALAAPLAAPSATEGAPTTPPERISPVSAPQVATGDRLTTDQGIPVSDDQNSLRAGVRGPSLLEDFHFREKMTQFDHERIPERVVHARGAGAHGVFELTESLEQYTTAKVLTDKSAPTPVFVRFSTVAGSRGSADTVRDARGFATKFYTSEGVWDLVGNNIPVFFIQDAIKFPDLVHALKPEPDVEIPQASSAHDTFYDFISLTPESMHMIMWIASDRAIPRSYRMMQGFGVHTFRLVNAAGRATFVKFHWMPRLGVKSLVWDEAVKLAGVDADFHRRDLARAIDEGDFPQYDLGVQLLAEDDVAKVTFDVLDATKLWPEEVVPVRKVGTLTLNRNPENYFVETEQVAFCTGNVVPGIDFTEDPLLQGRNFSYLDTQLSRFNGPNWYQLPINQPRSPVNNYQQDGFMRFANRAGKVNYEPNSLGQQAAEVPAAQGGFVTYPATVSGVKLRERSASFGDHYSQATLFFQSMTEPEKRHIIQALQFELGRVRTTAVKQRMLGHLANIDARLVREVAEYLGLPVPSGKPNTGIGTSARLSQERITPDGPRTARVAVLVADGYSSADVAGIVEALKAAGVRWEFVGSRLGVIRPVRGAAVTATASLLTAKSVQYDATFVPGGAAAATALAGNGDAVQWIEETFRHHKALGAAGEARTLVQGVLSRLGDAAGRQPGVVLDASGAAVAGAFVTALAAHRHWDRLVAPIPG
ncbi:MAG: catalase [Kineosporiaceae bacterium]